MNGQRSRGPAKVTTSAQHNRCPNCESRVIKYDLDYQLDCYLGPTLLDPTPLTLELAIACRITNRGIYHHTRNRAGHRHISRIWPHHTIPTTGHILPAHQCGAHIPTTLPPLDHTTIPTNAPF